MLRTLMYFFFSNISNRKIYSFEILYIIMNAQEAVDRLFQIIEEIKRQKEMNNNEKN